MGELLLHNHTDADMEPYTKDKSYSLSRPLWYKQDAWNGQTANQVKLWNGRLVNTLSGFKNPKWRSQIKAVENATTSADGVYTTKVSEKRDGYYSVTYNGYPSGYQDCNCVLSGNYAWYLASQGLYGPASNFWLPSLTLGLADNRARTAFFKQLRSAQISFGGPVFLGELRESLRMIRHPAQGLRNLLDNYFHNIRRRGIAKELRKLRNKPGRGRSVDLPYHWKKELSSAWLEGMFGWLPLFNDLQSASKAFNKVLKPVTVPLSAFGIERKHVETYFENWHNAYTNGFVPLQWTRTRYETAFVRYKGVLQREVNAIPEVSASADFGFTMAEFVPTAWQLCPWSFLFDYFGNIGDVLEAHATSTAGLRWVSKSEVTNMTLRVLADLDEKTAKKDSYYRRSYGQSSIVQLERGVWKRTPNAGLTIPDLVLDLPGKPAQFANMLSLFTQAHALNEQVYKPFGHRARRF